MDEQMPPNMASLAQQPAEPAQASAAGGMEQQEAGGGAEEAALAQEFRRGLDAIKTALYKDEATSRAFEDMIKPDKAVDSLSRATISLVTEIDKKIDIDEEILAPLTAAAALELIELAQAKGVNLDETQQKQVVSTAFEGIVMAYEVDPQSAADFIGEVGPEAEQQGIKDYQAALKG